MLLTDFFIALAVSTMVGDAFFHILPHMLGLHSHDHGDHDDHEDHDHAHYEEPIDDHDHDHDEEVDFALITAKIGVLVGSMYAMWLIGALMRLNGVGHGHSHGNVTELTSTKKEEEIETDDVVAKDGDATLAQVGHDDGEVKWSTIWGILIGDCFHNFVGTSSGEFTI